VISQRMIPRNLLFSVAAMVLIAVGMAVYMWHMRARVVAGVSGTVSSAHVAPPASGSAEQVTLYVAYDDLGILMPQVFRLPLPSDRQQRGEELLRFLIALYVGKPSPHPLGPGSELRNLYLVDPDLAVIDVNGAFSTGHPSGVLAEELTVSSLIRSLSTNIPGIKRVKILVDGKTQETLAGHADLSAFYDVGAVKDLALELQGTE
jgi:hypothetical protein